MTTQPLPHARFWMLLLAASMALLAALWSVGAAQATYPSSFEESGDDDSGGDDIEFTGILTAFPAGGGAGAYTIDGTTYTADGDTEFELEDGPLTQGGCVLVKIENRTPTVLEKIRPVSMSNCTGGDDDDDDDDGGHHGGDDKSDTHFYGLLVSKPADGLLGTWVVGNRTFTADANTRFEQPRGAFVVNGCLEVEFRSATPTIAKKIETESAFKCTGQNDDDDDGRLEWEGKLFGEIVALPANPNLLGIWTVGAFTFTVTAGTELDGHHSGDDGDFAVGASVKVEFRVRNGETIAKEVELVYPRHDGPRHDDDDFKGNLGHAWGSIESKPQSGNVGTWRISGVDYQVISSTRLEDNGTDLAIGTRVKVKFRVADDGVLVAWEIEATNRNGGVGAGHFKFVGFVDAAPGGDTLLGNWRVGGELFVADAGTVFEERDGLLVVGAYVEVEYQITGAQHIIKKLETRTPPGSGSDDHMGRLETGGDDRGNDALLSSAAPSAAAENEVWRIGGRDFVVTTATNLNSNGGGLTVGSTVLVNSYANAAGEHVATQITGVTIVSQQFMPMLQMGQ